MTNIEQWSRLPGQAVFDSRGQRIGDVRRVFFDETSNEPTWVTVGSRRFGEREAIVPLSGSRVDASGLALAVRGDLVKDAPTIDPDSDISPEQATEASQHYEESPSLSRKTSAQSGQPPSRKAEPEAEQPPSAIPSLEMTSFEEQFEVGKEPIAGGTARLHKSVETMPVEATVPLHHEQLRVEHLPAEAEQAEGEQLPVEVAGEHSFAEEDAQVTLHDERATISKKAVPVETVRLSVEASDREERLRDEIRRERIEVDDRTLHAEDQPAPARRR